MPYLEILGTEKPRYVPLDQTPMTIGRSTMNRLPIQDQQASRAHCVIESSVTGHRVRDLDSRNGTYHNGQRLDQPQPLAEDDEIQIGAVRIVYHAGEPPLEGERPTF